MNNDIINLADTIQGEINRMCITNELTELDTMYVHAKNNLYKLLFMVYDLKFKQSEDNKNIKIVIDIDKTKYNKIKKFYDTFPSEMKKWGLDAIRNGTPFDKYNAESENKK